MRHRRRRIHRRMNRHRLNGFFHESRTADTTDHWFTPKWILDALGLFDLDPCAAPESMRPYPTARVMWCLPEHDGLRERWWGRVWCNPPYGRGIDRWIMRMADHGRGTMLIFARTGTRAWQDGIFRRASSILFVRGRIHFMNKHNENGIGSPSPSALVAFGKEDVEILERSGIQGYHIRLRGEDRRG